MRKRILRRFILTALVLSLTGLGAGCNCGNNLSGVCKPAGSYEGSRDAAGDLWDGERGRVDEDFPDTVGDTTEAMPDTLSFISSSSPR